MNENEEAAVDTTLRIMSNCETNSACETASAASQEQEQDRLKIRNNCEISSASAASQEQEQDRLRIRSNRETSQEQERKRGSSWSWSEEEHKSFLKGLDKIGRGNWKAIHTNYVPSRTPTQIASHAQKYFSRQSADRKRRRTSVFDIPHPSPIKDQESTMDIRPNNESSKKIEPDEVHENTRPRVSSSAETEREGGKFVQAICWVSIDDLYNKSRDIHGYLEDPPSPTNNNNKSLVLHRKTTVLTESEAVDKTDGDH